MFCSQCGFQNADNSHFCIHCGHVMPVGVGLHTPVVNEKLSQVKFEYAGFWLRVGAFLIDGFVLYMALRLFSLFKVANYGRADYFGYGYLDFFSFWGIIFYWLYFALMESSVLQATLGKKLLHLQVTDVFGNRISFGKATARYFSKIISAAFFGIGFLAVGLTRKKQGWHDIIAQTIVVSNAEILKHSTPKVFQSQESSLIHGTDNVLANSGNTITKKQNEAFDLTRFVVWLSRFGMLAVLSGLGYFFKLSIDRGWLQPVGRIVVGFVVAILLIALGDFLRKKMPIYATVLVGGAIPLLYFTVFAAYGWYHIFPQYLTFIFAVLITGISYVLAKRYDSNLLSVMTLIGAYVTPALAGIVQSQPTAMYVYLSLLSALILALLMDSKRFALLYAAAAGSAYYYLFLWDKVYQTQSSLFFALGFLVFSVAVFVAGGGYALKKTSSLEGIPGHNLQSFSTFSLFCALFYTLAVSGLLKQVGSNNYISIMYLFGALVWLVGYLTLFQQKNSKLNYLLIGTSMVFAIFAILYKSDNAIVDAFLAVTGVISVFVALKYQIKELRIFGFVLLSVNVFRVLYYKEYPETFLWNWKFISLVLEAIALSLSGLAASLYLPKEDDDRKIIHWFQNIGALLLWFGVSRELFKHFTAPEQMNTLNISLSLSWVVLASLLFWIAISKHFHAYRKFSVFLFGLSLCKLFLYDAFHLDVIYKTISFIVFGLVLLGVSFFFLRDKEKITKFLEGESEEGLVNKN